MDEQYVGLAGEPGEDLVFKSCRSLRRYLPMLLVRGCLFLCLLIAFFERQRLSFFRQAHARSSSQGPFVSTACGTFTGAWESSSDSVSAFRGIQFGRVRRWLPPDEVCSDPYEILPATANGPACLMPGASHEGQDEQCLYLNIFTPWFTQETSAFRSSRLPIVAYIHGGGLATGSGTSDGHLRKLVSLTGEVIVVSCQYRLGVLGFMALRELSERDPRGTSGNYGFMDQQLCLKWIQRHGGTFGGDTSRVTILGQSAGGTSVLAQLLVPGNQGLFHGAIALSPSPGAPRLPQAEKERQDRSLWLPRTGCSAAEDVVSCLLSMDAGQLASSLPDSYCVFDNNNFPIQPDGHISWTSLSHVDGVTIPVPTDTVYPGRLDVPVLIESMGAEDAGNSRAWPRGRGGEKLHQMLMARFSGAFGDDFASKVEELYAGSPSPQQALYRVDSDIGNHCGLMKVAQAVAATSSSEVYAGVVEAGPRQTLHWCDCLEHTQGYPFHGWDLAAGTEVWDQLWCACPNYQYEPTNLDRQFAYQQRYRWLALAKYGRLDASDGWTSLKHRNAYGLVHHSNVTMKALPDERCAFWESHNVSANWYWTN